MIVITNPFDAGGYTLAEMNEAINILPNVYSRLGQMGLFRFGGITQRSVTIEQAEGVLNLPPTVPLGGAATVAGRDTRTMRSFTAPWIPHDDVITPQDIQGVRGVGVADAADPLATVMKRKLTRMRIKHAQNLIGRGRATVPIFLLVPQVRLAKRLDLDRDAERALESVPGLIVANWVEGRS